ncbi:hypothetical protein BC833DRAFT_587610 [Globomyces pollinis-pini]|nr:hypothetical protein BC833DRAFT_587610 [Globomyces pollinis-pini]
MLDIVIFIFFFFISIHNRFLLFFYHSLWSLFLLLGFLCCGCACLVPAEKVVERDWYASAHSCSFHQTLPHLLQQSEMVNLIIIPIKISRERFFVLVFLWGKEIA